MTADTVVLFPGQGAYSPGLFAGRSEPELAEVLRVVDRVAGEFGRAGVAGYLTRRDGPSAADLVRADPFALQLAVFAAAVGGFRLAARDGAGDVLVGHSMGEIAALTVAGAFDLADGARMVCHRSEALLSGCPRPGGMIALELQATRTAHLVGLVAEPELAVAVLNAPQQTVVAGPESALEAVARLAEALGVQATRLNAPFPFHSPMLGVAAERFAEAITGVRQHPLRARVYSPMAGGYVSDEADLKALLVRHLTTQVPFLTAIRELHAAGIRHFVECSPGGLSGLVRRTVPDVTTGPAPEAAPDKAPRVEAAPPNGVPRPAPGKAPQVQVPAAPPPAPAATPKPLDFGSVLEQLRTLYATTLGYPQEAITPDADLEADLGIDSLKRAEMLVKVTSHFELPGDNGKFVNHQTLADLAKLVVAARVPTR